MGTRGLLVFIVRGHRIYTFNLFDSYPEGLGAAIVEFILSLSEEDIATMVLRLEAIEWIDEDSPVPQAEQIRYYSAPVFHRAKNEYQSMRLRPMTDWDSLLHNMQNAQFLPLILDGRLGHLIKLREDDLFGEWAHYVDFARQTFVVGGNDQSWTFEELRNPHGFWRALVGKHIIGKRYHERLEAAQENSEGRALGDQYLIDINALPDPYGFEDALRLTMDEDKVMQEEEDEHEEDEEGQQLRTGEELANAGAPAHENDFVSDEESMEEGGPDHPAIPRSASGSAMPISVDAMDHLISKMTVMGDD